MVGFLACSRGRCRDDCVTTPLLLSQNCAFPDVSVELIAAGLFMNQLLARADAGASHPDPTNRIGTRGRQGPPAALDPQKKRRSLTVNAPPQLRALLCDLVDHLPVVIGRNLVGIYLYGSLTQAAFDAKRSDVDLLVVTLRDLSDRQFRELGKWLRARSRSNAWTSRLQMSFLLRDEVLTPNSRSCLYQFGRLKRSRSDGNPIIWKNVLENGIILHGPRPESFVPSITGDLLFQALKREVGYLRAELVEKPRSQWRDIPFYRAYAVMTLCRVLYTFQNGTVVSKPRAANWAIRHFRDDWRKLIICARESDAGKPRRVPLSPLRKFVAFTDARVRRRDLGRPESG